MKSNFFKIGTVILFLMLSFKADAFQEIVLETIPRVGPPQIMKNRIIYSIDIVFKSFVPQEYWLYYDRPNKKLIIDFYDVFISAPPLTIRGTDLISDPEVWNIESSMALSGKRAQVRFSIKDGLHYEAFSSTDSTICLQLWRYLETSFNKRKVRPEIIIPVISTLVAAAVAAIILVSKK
ncbi:MAG: hypothetical protein GX267_11995 [Fibrobacter sp.]|jgi:hypothetical protein|nr:hypothetical protein [Fibrobacter sp.]